MRKKRSKVSFTENSKSLLIALLLVGMTLLVYNQVQAQGGPVVSHIPSEINGLVQEGKITAQNSIELGGVPGIDINLDSANAKSRLLAAEARITILEALIPSLSSAPTGTVAFFRLGSCPAGWFPVSEAEGRYLVGLKSGGTLNAQVGTALTTQENRAVGQHTHSLTDPEHTHSASGIGGWGSIGHPDWSHNAHNADTASSGTGITISSTGSVAGTNAPYLQLKVCVKNDPADQDVDGWNSDVDCDDGNKDVWRLRYVDNDEDFFGVGNPVCVGNHPGYADVAGDCYDDNADVFPGQTAYFGTHRGDGSFDYNCDGSDEKRYTVQTTFPMICTSTYPGAGVPGWTTEVQYVDCGENSRWAAKCVSIEGHCESWGEWVSGSTCSGWAGYKRWKWDHMENVRKTQTCR